MRSNEFIFDARDGNIICTHPMFMFRRNDMAVPIVLNTNALK
jgi:hypothetical protein